MVEPLVYIVIVNYNGWGDTILCLESIFRLRYNNYKVIVVDNGSTDDSANNMKNWLEGRLNHYIPKDHPLRYLALPIQRQTVDYKIMTLSDVRQDVLHKLNIILLDENVGFAGGNNIAMILALADVKCKYVWILNNDTVVKDDSLSIITSLADAISKEKKVGIIGSKLLYFDDPTRINALGGRYFRCIGMPVQNLNNKLDNGIKPARIDYIVGAAMLVKREFILDVGLMSEEYFLYFEELDWILRGKRKKWDIIQCNDSIVYHKEGSTIGSSKRKKTKTPVTDYYSHRNRILITKKYFFYCLPSVLMASIVSSFLRCWRYGFQRMWLVLKAIYHGLKDEKGRYEGI
ncbi:MAG: glycosyltransferase family 2 protein [Thermodesulfovibrionales bacterium]|nr:glycosyltransferase family 2 protein [Thermodesulfovibrionales bacterium]